MITKIHCRYTLSMPQGLLWPLAGAQTTPKAPCHQSVQTWATEQLLSASLYWFDGSADRPAEGTDSSIADADSACTSLCRVTSCWCYDDETLRPVEEAKDDAGMEALREVLESVAFVDEDFLGDVDMGHDGGEAEDGADSEVSSILKANHDLDGLACEECRLYARRHPRA